MMNRKLPVILLGALMMASCAAVTHPTSTLKPPESLLMDCPEPGGRPQTNGQLADYALALRNALRVCNNDKAALREWYEVLE